VRAAVDDGVPHSNTALPPPMTPPVTADSAPPPPSDPLTEDFEKLLDHPRPLAFGIGPLPAFACSLALFLAIVCKR
jgi:hypothetical protein